MKFTLACLVSAAASTKTFLGIQSPEDPDWVDTCVDIEGFHDQFVCYFDAYCTADDECEDPCAGLMDGPAEECYEELLSEVDTDEADEFVSDLASEYSDIDIEDVIEYYEEYHGEENPCSSSDSSNEYDECVDAWICKDYADEDGEEYGFDWCVASYGVEASIAFVNAEYDDEDYDYSGEDFDFDGDFDHSGEDFDFDFEGDFDSSGEDFDFDFEDDNSADLDFDGPEEYTFDWCMEQYGEEQGEDYCQLMYSDDYDYIDDFGMDNGEEFGDDLPFDSWEQAIELLGDFDPCADLPESEAGNCRYYFDSPNDPCFAEYLSEEEVESCYEGALSFIPETVLEGMVPAEDDDSWFGMFAQSKLQKFSAGYYGR